MSVVYSQSELLQKEVFLVELVDSISMSKESMSHLKAVYFLRPTSENIQHLRRQFASPRFGEYHLCKLYKWFLREHVICSKLCRIIWNFDFKPFCARYSFTVFSNILKDTQIHILADSDEQEVVQQVQVTCIHEFCIV